METSSCTALHLGLGGVYGHHLVSELSDNDLWLANAHFFMYLWCTSPASPEVSLPFYTLYFYLANLSIIFAAPIFWFFPPYLGGSYHSYPWLLFTPQLSSFRQSGHCVEHCPSSPSPIRSGTPKGGCFTPQATASLQPWGPKAQFSDLILSADLSSFAVVLPAESLKPIQWKVHLWSGCFLWWCLLPAFPFSLRDFRGRGTSCLAHPGICSIQLSFKLIFSLQCFTSGGGHSLSSWGVAPYPIRVWLGSFCHFLACHPLTSLFPRILFFCPSPLLS